MKVQLFIPCFIDQVASHVGVATCELLTKLGCELIYPRKQTCCGQPAVNAGCASLGLEVMRDFVSHFSTDYPVVSPSASCVSFLNTYKDQCGGRAMPMYYELSDFINQRFEKSVREGCFIPYPHRVAFLKSCSSLREAPPVVDEALRLLRRIPSLDLVEDVECSTECCGYGGSFSLKFSAISDAMGRRKIANILKTNATQVTSTDMSCLLHLDKLIKADHANLQVVHLAEMLNASYQEAC